MSSEGEAKADVRAGEGDRAEMPNSAPERLSRTLRNRLCTPSSVSERSLELHMRKSINHGIKVAEGGERYIPHNPQSGFTQHIP